MSSPVDILDEIYCTQWYIDVSTRKLKLRLNPNEIRTRCLVLELRAESDLKWITSNEYFLYDSIFHANGKQETKHISSGNCTLKSRFRASSRSILKPPHLPMEIKLEEARAPSSSSR